MSSEKRTAPWGEVVEISRFPVKSMLGEALSSALVTARGLEHDRALALRCAGGKLGSGKSTRIFQKVDRIGLASARRVKDAVQIELPDGSVLAADQPEADKLLSEAFDQDVELVAEQRQTHFDDGPVHIVTRSSIERLEERSGVRIASGRLRANIIVDDLTRGRRGLDLRVGEHLVLSGGVTLRIALPMTRCVMVNSATRELPYDGRVLKAIAAASRMELGWVAEVARPGRVGLGNVVRLG